MLKSEKPIGSVFRGSRKHVLDLISRPDYVDDMNDLLAGAGVCVRSCDYKVPVSAHQPKEATFREFRAAKDLLSAPMEFGAGYEWVCDRYKSQTWDLISECAIGNEPGVLLVEAKAHEGELNRSGKALAANASDQSSRNHDRIGEIIANASRTLGQYAGDSVQFSRDSHYQLANRLTTAVQLAYTGTPVCLLYLGFVGDSYFASDYFQSDEHWQRAMGAYLQGNVPLSLPELRVQFPEADLVFLVRSLRAEPSSRA
jgi:hypothetical protein